MAQEVMPMGQPPSGELMLAAATAAALRLSRGQQASDVARMGAFFTVLGDQIALLAASMDS